MVLYTRRVCPRCHGERYHELWTNTGYSEPWICDDCGEIFDRPTTQECDSDMISTRRWEILLWFKTCIWRFHVAKPFGKGEPFLHETWVGPICYRLWRDPKSVSSVSQAVRIV